MIKRMNSVKRRALKESANFRDIPTLIRELDYVTDELEESGANPSSISDLIAIRKELEYNYALIKQCAEDIGLYNA